MTVLVCCVLGLIGGAVYLALAPKKFVAASTLIIQQVTPAGAAKDESLAEAQAEIAGSSDVLRLADKDRGLADLPSLAAISDPVPVVKRDLHVDANAHRNTLSVTYASTHREDAIKVVDLVVDAYRNYASESTARRGKQLEDVIRAEQTKIDDQLNRAQEALAKFDTARFTVNSTDAATQRASSLADALSRAELETLAAKKKYDDAVADAGPSLKGLDDKQLEETLQGSAATVADDSGDVVGEEVLALARQLVEFRRTYAQNHPAVVRASQRLQQLRLALVAQSRQRWQSTQAREAGLREAYEKSQRDTVGQAARATERARLVEEVSRERSRADAMDVQLTEMLRSNAASALTILVDSPAAIDATDHPPLPRPAPTLATATAIGLVLGGLFALVGEFREAGSLRHVMPIGGSRTAGDAGSALNLRLLASVPSPERDESDAPADIARASYTDPFGPIANAVRSLRLAIETDGKLPGTILLTAAAERQGTTTMATNLAMTIARENRRVLLVDLNFASPLVAALLHVAGVTGLAELIQGGDPLQLIRPTDVPRLDALPAGVAPADSAALLNTEHFTSLLTMLAQAYDHVIFDAPPLSRGDDARIVASMCEGTVLVSRSTSASLRRAAGARDLLLMIGASLLGVAISRGEAAGDLASLPGDAVKAVER